MCINWTKRWITVLKYRDVQITFILSVHQSQGTNVFDLLPTKLTSDTIF